MINFLVGMVVGFVVASIGPSNIVQMLERGVDTVKIQIKEAAK